MKESELKKERLKLLNETVNFYNSNNRAVGQDGNCVYLSPGGNKCAIGRLLKDELCVELDNSMYGGVSSYRAFEKIPDELKALGQEFLSEIQGLHDQLVYWNKEGLSMKGKLRVEGIKKYYNLD